jgi:3-hydroxybutyrate dehydrogenase
MSHPSTNYSSTPLRVLVTGGTGTLGQALVTAFAKAGYRTVFQYHRNRPAADRLATEYAATGYQIDFSQPFEPPAGDFDVLINNAGINESDEVTHQVDPSVWTKMLHLNVTVPFLLCRAVLPGMMRRGWGRIVNIGSIYSVRAAAKRAPYVTAKHGLSGLTKAVAKEYATHGITCNEICPSAVDSSMMDRIAKDRADREGRTPDEVLDSYRELSPANRLATAEEVASAALFLSSASAGFINGASIAVDGGLVA